MTYLLLKAGHLIAMVCWFAALFYLPRLFVYHSMSEDRTSRDRFNIMERKLYRGIMTPAGIATILLGSAMLWKNPALLDTGWMQLKLTLVLLLVAYHLVCGFFLKQFATDSCQKSHI